VLYEIYYHKLIHHKEAKMEHGFEPDELNETGRLKTDSSTRRVSFSDNVEILWIPRIQESEWDLCFYNSDDIAEFRLEEWVEQCSTMESEGFLKAFSSCWKERDDEEMTDTTHDVSQSSFEDDNLQVVLLEDSFNNGDYQASSSSSSSSSSSNKVSVCEGSTDALHAETDPVNRFCGTDLPTNSLDSSYLAGATTVASRVVLGEPENELSRPPITSSTPECEQHSDPPGKLRVSFSSFARVMDLPRIDLRDVHLCFYSQEDIAQFRHDKWVEEHGFDPDDLNDRDRLKTDSSPSSRRVSFSDNVETPWIPIIQESEWHLCFYNSDDIAEFRHEVWVEECSRNMESGGLFKALSSGWKARERDDEEMTDSTHYVSQCSFEDHDDLEVVLLEDSFNKGDYQDSSSSGSRVSFSDDIQVKHFPKVGPSEWGDCYYEADELADFRQEAWVEACARHAMGLWHFSSST
jgi:hypothetical protein